MNKVRFSEEFYEGFIESLELEVDRVTDQVLDWAHDDYVGSPFFVFLDELMKIEERVEQMVERGYLPREVADKALERFWEYVDQEKDFPAKRWNEA